MTVKELINQLYTFDPNMPVVFEDEYLTHWEIKTVELAVDDDGRGLDVCALGWKPEGA